MNMYEFSNLTIEETAAAQLTLLGKRDRSCSVDDHDGNHAKKSRDDSDAATGGVCNLTDSRGELKPFPYFYYTDYSTLPDPDPLIPLTPPGRVPNFVAKMHAILSRPDLMDVIAWMPHGRSFKILKPRDFEIRVLPVYFEHSKFSSFIRQANGWGFRRITSGRDRNSYYHPLFLRGLPHLCKAMKRPGVAKKLTADPDHEPDLYKIAEEHPVPLSADDDSVLLHCVIQGGPKARMPIYSGSLLTSRMNMEHVALPPSESKKVAAEAITAKPSLPLTPGDKETISTFQSALGASEASAKLAPIVAASPQQATPSLVQPFPSISGLSLPANSLAAGAEKQSPLATANQLALAPMAAFSQQWAAGFMAACQMDQTQFSQMMQPFIQQQMNAAASSSNSSGIAALPVNFTSFISH